MKKAKRFLTGLLSAALALSLCAMPAMAAEDSGATPGTTPNPVWTETEGSITIHKYEWNETNRGPATGEAEDAGRLPSNGKGEAPTPLAGATFTVYQVKNEAELKEYYDNYDGEKNVAWPTSWEDYAGPDATTGGYKLKDGVTATPFGSKTTDASGIVQFGKVPGEGGETEVLPLGLYLVLETETPDSVRTACEPFFVSVPMTKVSDDTNGGLTDWLYDVHVFPKNSTAYGQAVLQKVGKQSGTNPEVTTMQGYKFKLYKKNDDGTWTWIQKKPANGVDNKGEWLDADNETGVLTTGADGKISVSGLTKGVYAFVETEVNANDGYILDSGIAYVFKIGDNGEMGAATEDDVVNEKYPEKATSFDFTAFNATEVKVKNYKPDFKKEITGKKDADYGIGDDVPYTLTVNVPENVAKLKTFTVSDEMNSDQLVVNDDILVKGKAGDAAETTFTAGTEYTLTKTNADGKSGFTIAFNTKEIAAYAGGTITITYTAKLQDGASVGAVGNVNSADLKYSKKTDISTTEEDPPYDIHDEAVVYTFKTGILKKGDNDELLDNVEFTLYKKYNAETDTTYEENNVTAGVVFKGEKKPFLTDAEAKKLGLNATEDPNTKWFAVMNLTTGEDGKAVANGLPTGEYKLVETKTHKDYNLLTKPVDANLTLDCTTKWNDTKTFDADGKLIKNEYKSTEVKNKNDDSPYKYAEILIINRKGFKLPTTGGFGTLLFSGIGVLLVVAGVGVLLSLKKKNRA
ncbi:SpaH/EbpB family LPXTG-anchored major pilin [uncultured Gemmiger sp.]|uniref:SpaH/EbpB family LPXTG-anchored major pilin n=1 Tax=uncultured Gemmiger sp. TaxID=1623490 RepID=UPI0025DA29B2|nr:SpaH/EbpB family LPXTG-anchored major pilin [uncultured Gemmiger sp.]